MATVALSGIAGEDKSAFVGLLVRHLVGLVGRLVGSFAVSKLAEPEDDDG